MATTLSGSSGGTVITTTTVPPSEAQGRLTLTSATPVLTATVSAATTIYYALYTGNLIPIYSGTAWSMTTFTELSNATAQSSTGSAGPAVVANNSNYDLFVWSNGGTLTLTRGPPFTSDTVRGTGVGTTEISRVLGIWTNTVAITNGPGAGLGTYVGTVRSNGTATIDWKPNPAAAAGGGNALLGVYNAYNKVDVVATSIDSTSTWNYSTNTWRAANGNNSNRISVIQGCQEDYVEAQHVLLGSGNDGSSTVWGYVGIGYNSTSSPSGLTTQAGPQTRVSTAAAAYYAVQPLGWNYFQALETGNGSTTMVWYANSLYQTISVRGGF